MHTPPHDCTTCPRLAGSRKAVVNGVGPLPAPVLVVGQGPGRQEEEATPPTPLIGWTGEKVAYMFNTYTPWPWEEVRRTNVTRCRPPQGANGDLKPNKGEVAACGEYLLAEIDACRPTVIIVLGDVALQWFLPGKRISAVHGQRFDWHYNLTGRGDSSDSITVVPMYHLAAAHPARNPALMPVIIDDWRRLGEWYGSSSLATYNQLDYSRVSSSDTFGSSSLGTYTRLTGPQMASVLEGVKEFAFDFETTDPTFRGTFQARRAREIGFSVAVRGGEAFYCTDSAEYIRGPLESEDVVVYAHNAVFEYTVGRSLGITIRNLHDTKLMAYCLRRPSTHLKGLAWSELGIQQTRYEEVDWDDAEAVTQYGAADSDITFRLAHHFIPLLHAAGLWELYDQVERPGPPVVAEMQNHGVWWDNAPIQMLSRYLHRRIIRLEEEIGEYIHESVNLDSGPQLSEALYGDSRWRVTRSSGATLRGRLVHTSECVGANRKACVETACASGIRSGAQTRIQYIPPGLALPILSRTDSGSPATDMDTLRRLARDGETATVGVRRLVDLLVERASAQQALNYNVDTLPLLVQEDGRLHGSFHQAGVWEEKAGDAREGPVTGRFSSSGPNLTNIIHHGDSERPYVPIWATFVRRAFAAPPGRVLVKADLGQEEPRIGAALSGDTALQWELEHGDVYKRVSAVVYGIPADEIDREQRQIGKRNFMAWLNGAGANGILTAAWWLKPHRAWAVIFSLRKQFHVFETWRVAQVAHLQEHGYVTTYFNRRIYRPAVWTNYSGVVEHAERAVAPDAIQGTGADVLKQALWKVARELAFLDGHAALVLTVHDEVVIECDEHLRDVVVEIVTHMADGLLPIIIPVEVEVGRNWADMEEI